MLRLEDLFQGKYVKEYLEERETIGYMLEGILPYEKTDALDFEYLIGEDRAPIAASFTAYADGGRYIGREGLKKFAEELRPIKLNRKLDGKMYVKYKTQQASLPAMIKEIFNDIGAVYDGVRARTELMRAEALTTGKLVIDENGIIFEVDYGVPAANKLTYADMTTGKAWDNAEADPVADLIEIIHSLEFEPEGGIISKQIASLILANDNVRLQVNGVIDQARPITWAEFNNFLAGRGLPRLVINNDKVRDLDTLAERKVWPDNILVFTNAGVGETLVGPTEESVHGKGIVRAENGIYVRVLELDEPAGIYSRGTATSLVGLPGASRVVIFQTHDL